MYITAKEAQAILGVSQPTIYKILHNPNCPTIRKYKRFLIDKEKFIKWAIANKWLTKERAYVYLNEATNKYLRDGKN